MFKFHAKNLVEEKVANATGGSTGNSPIDETMREEQIPSKNNRIQDKSSKVCRCS